MLKDKIREILEKHHLGCCGGDYCDFEYPESVKTSKGNQYWSEVSFNQALSAILTAVRKSQPSVSEIVSFLHPYINSAQGTSFISNYELATAIKTMLDGRGE